jgi:hypothetical protein
MYDGPKIHLYLTYTDDPILLAASENNLQKAVKGQNHIQELNI